MELPIMAFIAKKLMVDEVDDEHHLQLQVMVHLAEEDQQFEIVETLKLLQQEDDEVQECET